MSKTDATKELEELTANSNCMLPIEFIIFRHFLHVPMSVIVTMDEIQRLHKRFMKLDKNNSGTIDKDEFLSIPGISSNPLAHRVIDIFDEDGGGDVDFKEFLLGLSAFSSKGQKDAKLKCIQHYTLYNRPS